MHIGQSISVFFLAMVLCACGGGEGVDTTGRLNAVSTHGVVSSVAGKGVGGYANGSATESQFKAPGAVAVGSDGTIYIADTENHRIRKSVNGVVSTLAGNGVAAFVDGTGEAASFSSPRGIAVDASGNVYVADSGNHRIRKILPTGEVVLLAGDGTVGSGDNSASPELATFDDPRGIAVNSDGSEVYVSDFNRYVIRKITANAVETIAGSTTARGAADGVGVNASFTSPWGLALSSSGNLYVADVGDWLIPGNYLIRKIELNNGYVSTLAGQPGVAPGKQNGPAAEATFNMPSGVAVDSSETVYVADSGNNLIRKITAVGEVSTLAGNGSQGNENGPGTESGFNSPRGIAVDSGGNVFVADTGNHLIRRISK